MVRGAPRPKCLPALRPRLAEVAVVQTPLVTDLLKQLLELLDCKICVCQLVRIRWPVGYLLGHIVKNILIKMIAAQPDTLAGTRNRALLSLGYDFLARRSELVAIRCDDLKFTPDGALKGMIRKSKTDQYGKGRLVFGSERSAKLVRKWLRLKPNEVQPVFCAINHGKRENRAICDRNVNDIIKRSVVKVKRCERPSDLEV